jgi:hypothetical protein
MQITDYREQSFCVRWPGVPAAYYLTSSLLKNRRRLSSPWFGRRSRRQERQLLCEALLMLIVGANNALYELVPDDVAFVEEVE